MSIRFKLTLFMIITVLVTASLSLTFMVLSVRRKFEQRFYEDSEGMLNSAAINLKTDFTKGFSAAQYWSENHNLISWVEQGQPEGTLKADVMRDFQRCLLQYQELLLLKSVYVLSYFQKQYHL